MLTRLSPHCRTPRQACGAAPSGARKRRAPPGVKRCTRSTLAALLQPKIDARTTIGLSRNSTCRVVQPTLHFCQSPPQAAHVRAYYITPHKRVIRNPSSAFSGSVWPERYLLLEHSGLPTALARIFAPLNMLTPGQESLSLHYPSISGRSVVLRLSRPTASAANRCAIIDAPRVVELGCSVQVTHSATMAVYPTSSKDRGKSVPPWPLAKERCGVEA